MGGVNGFNENRRRIIQAPNIKVLDETMSAFRPQTRKFGNLPHLSYILRKPEPLGTEFKTMAIGGECGMYTYYIPPKIERMPEEEGTEITN